MVPDGFNSIAFQSSFFIYFFFEIFTKLMLD